MAIFGAYEILDDLGAGGMSRIYRARDARLGRDVALKVLKDSLVRDPAVVERFVREARAASALNHPNIVTIFDAGEFEGQQFIVMEMVKGKTLRSIILEEHQSLDALPGITIQIARALAAAHAAGIVHRDIKPENVMVRDDGYVKVVDFGVARLLPAALDADSPASMQTMVGTVLGTPRYMSPEHVGGESVGSASDIFSLGVVLYEWVTSQHPFPAETIVKMLFAIMSQSVVAPSHLNPAVPARLEALILEMLAKDPTERPTAGDIIDRLSDRSPSSGTFMRPELRTRVDVQTVGRVRERKALHATLHAVSRGTGTLVGVAGEPGIGKTSLVEEVLRDIASDPTAWFVARGRCSERLAGSEAYLPFLEAFDSMLRGAGREQVSRLLKTFAPSWYLQLSVITPATGVAEEQKAGSRERLKRELVALLGEMCVLRPLALFLEDVHWADDATLDLLAYIAQHFSTLHACVVVTYRPEELQLSGHPFLALRRDLEARGLASEIALGFLGRGDIADYLSLIFPRSRFPDALVSLLHARTEGNPLFMSDLVRDLRDRGTIARDGDGWVLTREIAEFEQQLPASIRSMVQRKIDALDTEDRDLLVVASVQGARFDTAIVARAIGTDAAAVEERLDVLEREHAFVRLVGEDSLPDGAPSSQYQFVHVLYQNGLYASLRPVRRAAMSGAIARTMAEAHHKDLAPVAAELALLFETARDFPSTAKYFLAAAKRAADVFADKEAIRLAARGVAALHKTTQSPESARLELELQLALGKSLIRTQGYAAPDVERAYTRARQLCEHGQDPVRMCLVLHGLWQYFCVKGDLVKGLELAEQLLALASVTGDSQLVAIAHRTFGTPSLHRAHYAEVIAHMDSAIALMEPQHVSRVISLTGTDIATGALTWAALANWQHGHPDRARAQMDRAMENARQLRHPFSQAHALAIAGWLAHYRRSPDTSLELANALLEISLERQFEQWISVGFILRGWATAELGDAAAGIAEIHAGLSAFERAGAGLNLPHFQCMLAEALRRDGQLDEALAVVDRALATADRNHDRCWEPGLLDLAALLLRDLHRDAEAEARATDAIARARSRGARSLELRATVTLCRLWSDQGKMSEARDALTPLHAWFTEGFDTVEWRDASTLLASQPD